MSHYQYQPSTGRFISNAYVNLSFEEMRWEYYQEMDENSKRKQGVAKKCDKCCNNINSETNIRKRHKFQTDLKNKKNKNETEYNLENDSQWEAMSIEEPESPSCSDHCRCNESSMNDRPDNVCIDKNNVADDLDNRKRQYESDCEDISNLKKMKCCDESFTRFRSINDEINILSTSILNSSKKSRKPNGDKNNKTNYKSLKNKWRENSQNIAKEERVINSIIELRKMGNDFVKMGDYLSAIEKYSESLQSSGKYSQLSSIAYSNRAFALMKLNRFDEALQDCDESIRNNNRDFKVRLRRIKCLIELDRYNEAKSDVVQLKDESNLSECDQLLEIVNAKQEYSNSITKGEQFETARSYDKAFSCYSKAISIDGNSAFVFQNRARVLFHMERYRESLSDLNEALRLTPMNTSAIYNRVGCLLKLERFQEAIRDAEQLMKQDPSPLHGNLLKTSIEAEKRANKRNYYEILEVHPKSTVAEIKKQYRKMALMYHPDKLAQVDPLTKSQQEEKFKKLTLILKTLTDPVSRQMYDYSL